MKNRALYILFARRPEPGAVKTRLARAIGAGAAADLYRALLFDSIRNLTTAGRPFAVAYTPADAGPFFKEIAPGARNFPQDGSDLGERISRAVRRSFRKGFSRVIVVGSDIVGLTPEILHRAERSLNDHTAVIGPCRDGGYYLLGLDRHLPELFTGIEWGGDCVFAATAEKLRKNEISFRILPELIDLDRIEDLRMIAQNLDSLRGTQTGSAIERLLKTAPCAFSKPDR